MIFNNDKEIPYIVVETFLGKDIVGMKYHQIWDDSPLPNDSPENAFRLISGDFVTTEDGTELYIQRQHLVLMMLLLQKMLNQRFLQC